MLDNQNRSGFPTLVAVRSRLRIPLALLLIVTITLCIAELGTRVVMAVRMGPRTFAYGTRWFHNAKTGGIPHEHAQFHGNSQAGYTKYFPHETKYDSNSSGKFTVAINNQGLRGADIGEKEPGLLRVVTLGASSTFGFGNRDDETYPHYLEEALNRNGRRFEVVNLGVPHATTDNILALYFTEGVALRPDVVTFYEGANDSMGAITGTACEGLWKRAGQRSLLIHLVSQPWSPVLPCSADFQETARRHFLANLGILADECRRRGIPFIVMTQQVKSVLVPPEKLPGVTYSDEVRIVQERVASNGKTADMIERTLLGTFLLHAQLMADLREWAAKTGTPLVDGVAVLDHHRDWLTSWVHLRAEANRMLAEALATEILKAVDGTNNHYTSSRRE